MMTGRQVQFGCVTKEMFFDRSEIIAKLDAATRKVLGNFGGYCRRVARNSMRKARGPSQPGQPPHVHTGLLKNGIAYGYDASAGSVVIGPTPLKGMGIVPPLLEYGGRAMRRVRAGKKRKDKMVTYAPRPFMGPAFDKTLPQLPAMWAGSVK